MNTTASMPVPQPGDTITIYGTNFSYGPWNAALFNHAQPTLRVTAIDHASTEQKLTALIPATLGSGKSGVLPPIR